MESTCHFQGILDRKVKQFRDKISLQSNLNTVWKEKTNKTLDKENRQKNTNSSENKPWVESRKSWHRSWCCPMQQVKPIWPLKTLLYVHMIQCRTYCILPRYCVYKLNITMTHKACLAMNWPQLSFKHKRLNFGGMLLSKVFLL